MAGLVPAISIMEAPCLPDRRAIRKKRSVGEVQPGMALV